MVRRETEAVRLLNEVTVTATSERVRGVDARLTFQATGQITGGGPDEATIDVEASNDGVNFLVLGTISLTLPASLATVTDGFASDARWKFFRFNVTAISGTGAAVSAFLGA